MDLYVGGHGYIVHDEPAVTIPSGFTLIFYCARECMFDGRWEKAIREGTVTPQSRPLSGFGENAFEMTTVRAGEQCINHVLTRPGNMMLYDGTLREMKEIKPLVKGAWMGEKLNDKDRLAIKDKKNPILRLSEIMAALAVAVSGGAVVHWCACRSPYDEDEAREQAIDMPKTPGTTPKTVWQ